jgi:hypothetical protein
MKTPALVLATAALACTAGCAGLGGAPAAPEPIAKPRVADMSADQCSSEVARLQARLAAETAERHKVTRAAQRREDTLRKQLEAMKSIERGILERDERIRTEAR